MILEGVVIGGRIELDTPSTLPDGTRVRLEVLDEEAGWDNLPPPEPYNRDQELALLRQAHDEANAGLGVEARTFLKELALQYNLPLEPSE